MNSVVHDFAVIGGGPSGSTVATLLARKGYSVALYEMEKFPRQHIGESLLPAGYHLFEQLGVLDEMMVRYSRKPGVQFVSPDGKLSSTYCFDMVIPNSSSLSFHVTRADFDDLLLRNSEKSGAQVFEEHRVQEVDFNAPHGCVQMTVVPRGKAPEMVLAKQLIDASGQNTFLAKKINSKKAYPNLNRAAIASHWVVDELPESLREGLIQIVYLGGEKLGWFFVIPLELDSISIGVVLNSTYMKAKREELMAQGVKDWQQQLYMDEIALSPHVSQIIENAQQRMPLLVNADYSYYSNINYGDNYTIVGDANAFLDPIFSSGVYMGMKSAFLVADALDKKMKDNSADRNKHIENAYTHIQGAYLLVGKFISYFYNQDAFNLAEFGNTASNAHFERAYSLLHTLLSGDFFDSYQRYTQFLDFLQDPKQFIRYKQYVIDKTDRSLPTCRRKHEDMFSDFLRAKKRGLATVE